MSKLKIESLTPLDGEPKIMWGEGTPWKTKSAFYTYLRGCLRKAWMRHPNKIKVINATRYAVPRLDKYGKPMLDKKGKPKTVWNCTCPLCGFKGGMKNFQVDHIVAPGALNNFEDIPSFIERLIYVKEEDLRVICTLCNKTLQYADKQGISFEEARLEKQAIDLINSKKDKQWLIGLGVVPESSSPKRRVQIVKILKESLAQKDK